jgi:hypothetical protein
MKGKIILIIISLVGSFILQAFTKMTWIFPLVAFIIFIFIFIIIVVKILKRNRGSSGGEESCRYFNGIFSEMAKI